MVTIQILCVGKLKESFWTAAEAEYAKRLSSFCKITITQLPEEKLPENPSGAQIETALAREGTAILTRVPKNARITALCVEGETFSSEVLASWLTRQMVDGVSTLVFVIGGSYGLHPTVKDAAHLRLSMSLMTFPHHLARIMVLEQLYRTFKINEGSKYHK